MKKILFLTALLCASVAMFAASNLCGVAPQHPAGGSGTVVFSWSTDDNGDVVVTIAPTGETTSATFRGTGFEGKLNGFTVLSGEGFETSEPASKYFEMKSSVAGETTCKLYRTGEYDLPAPCQLKFTAAAGQALAWVAGTVDMYDMTTPWVYTYGTLCGSELTTPSITSISDGVITFDAIDGATSYKAYIYRGSSYFASIDVTSGSLMTYLPYLAGTYQVRLRAFSDTQYSDFSEPFSWEIVSDNISGNLPPSSVNKRSVSSEAVAEVYVSLETDLVTGNILGIISPINAADDDYVYWREDGIRLSGFKYNGEAFTDYFDAEFTQSHQIPNPGVAKIDTIHFYPKTTGEHIPVYGGIISYSGGTLVWHYNDAGTWKGGVSFPDYIYGAGCGTLSRPIISSVTSSGVISFAAVPDATSYKAYVYNSAFEKVYEQVVTSGATINYIPYLADTYRVYLKAFGEDDAYSSCSASVDWVLPTNPAGDLPKSKVNKIIMTNGDNATAVYFSAETDLMTGNVEFIISAIDPANEEYTYWREDGVRTANLAYNGATFSDYFDRVSLNNVPEGTKKIIFAPKTTGENIPAYGGEIAFHGTTVWNYGDGKNTYNNGGFIFDYVYGTGCGTLTRPIISSVISSGVISFAEVAGATSYKAYVYNSDLELLYEQIVTPGATINYSSASAGTCKVYLKAFGEDDAYSAISAPVDWNVPPTPTPTDIDKTNTEIKAVKVIENGQLVIIKNGVKYNVAGQQVK